MFASSIKILLAFISAPPKLHSRAPGRVKFAWFLCQYSCRILKAYLVGRVFLSGRHPLVFFISMTSLCKRHCIPLRRIIPMAKMPDMLVTPAIKVKNGPSLSRRSSGCIAATPPAERAQQAMFADAAAVLGFLQWMSIIKVLKVYLTC